MSRIRDAFRDLVVEFDERPHPEGGVAAHGVMRFGTVLEGPPGRLHGGHHAYVRTFPVLERLRAHDPSTTFPCDLDVHIRRALPLETPVPFEARHRADDRGFELVTRFDGSERLLATLRSRPRGPLLDRAELDRLRTIHQASTPPESNFRMFGVTVHLAPELVFVEANDPTHAAPSSQIGGMLESDGTIGPALVATQLDSVGAIAQGTRMRHPHFTKHIAISYAEGRIPAETPLLFVADRTTIEDHVDSETAKVEVDGRLWGTACIRVALVDARFEHAFAVGRVTVHPVDPAKFEPLQSMRKLRQELP